DISFADRCIIAFGNEGHGFSNELRALRGNGFYIPVRKELDSLNLATCVGITVFFTECLFRHKA
ncbi:MAG: TrmH family RNA methyltransferase, partial [Candidatus Cloacimonadia bacterium]